MTTLWERDFVLAVLFGFLVGGCLGGIYVIIHQNASPDLHTGFDNNYVAVLTLMTALIPSIPTFLITRRWWAASLAGGVWGATFGLINLLAFPSDPTIESFVFGHPEAAFFGLVTGLGGWLIGAGLVHLRAITPPVNTRFARGVGRYWWTFFFGILGGLLANIFWRGSLPNQLISSVFFIPSIGLLPYPFDALVPCIIVGANGFITMRMVGTRILTGFIAGIAIVLVDSSCRYFEFVYLSPYYYGSLNWFLLQITPFYVGYIVVAMVMGFIGGWLATRGRNP